MFINQKSKVVIKIFVSTFVVTGLTLLSNVGWSQDRQFEIEQVRWKSEAQVREMMGEPNSVLGPVGTHASYTLWKYDKVTIAFANNHAFHQFDKDSLKKFKME